MMISVIVIVLVTSAHIHLTSGALDPLVSLCPSEPTSASLKSARTCRVVIVGGGPGGMLSAYLLRHLGSDLCVIDKNVNFGLQTRSQGGPQPQRGAGKMQDYPVGPPPMNDSNVFYGDAPKVFGTCGLRVSENQFNMRCLAHKLNVTLQEQNFDTIINARGQWRQRSVNGFLPAYSLPSPPNPANVSWTFNLPVNFSKDGDLEAALYNFVFVNTSDGQVNPITGEIVESHPYNKCQNYSYVSEYVREAIGPEGLAFLAAGNTFPGDWDLIVDVCQYVLYIQVDVGRCCTEFWPVGGFSQFWITISRQLRANGVRLFPGNEISCLYKAPVGSNKYGKGIKYVAATQSGQIWKGERMIINSGPGEMISVGGSLGTALNQDPQMKGIKPIPNVVYNAFYPEAFWAPFRTHSGQDFRIITDGVCTARSEFPSNQYLNGLNASRPIYTCDPTCVAQWTALYEHGGIVAVREQARRDLEMILGVHVPQPTLDLYSYRPNAWHYMQPFQTGKGITMDTIMAWAKKPLNLKHLCMVGEAYDLKESGWAEGAWVSATHCLRAQFKDLLGADATNEMENIIAGCPQAQIPEADRNGTACAFSNEQCSEHVFLNGTLPPYGSPQYPQYTPQPGSNDIPVPGSFYQS